MTMAVDLAKNTFEVAFADKRGQIVGRRRLTRPQFQRLVTEQGGLDVVMEACGTAHYWGRIAQAAGHQVTLLPTQHVRPFVRRQKTDRTDVTGLIDARGRAGVHPVPVKTVAQQEVVALHRIREQWKTTRTARINTVRGLLAEQGITLPAGAGRVRVALGQVIEDADQPIPGRLRRMLAVLATEIADLETRLTDVERELKAFAQQDSLVAQLQTIPGVGLLTATAFVGSVAHIHSFRRARCFASWLGLTAREHSSGGRRRLGGITKQGDVYLRCLLTHGARCVLQQAKRAVARQGTPTQLQRWALEVADRRGYNRATIAVANKLARIIWAVWAHDTKFHADRVA
jgi:transposase